MTARLQSIRRTRRGTSTTMQNTHTRNRSKSLSGGPAGGKSHHVTFADSDLAADSAPSLRTHLRPGRCLGDPHSPRWRLRDRARRPRASACRSTQRRPLDWRIKLSASCRLRSLPARLKQNPSRLSDRVLRGNEVDPRAHWWQVRGVTIRFDAETQGCESSGHRRSVETEGA